MKNTVAAIILLLIGISAFSQFLQKPSVYEINKAPQWAILMYSENPNVFAVDSAYQEYFSNQTFVKSYHTQYYKRWKRSLRGKIDSYGRIISFNDTEEIKLSQQMLLKRSTYESVKSGTWNPIGPFTVKNNSGEATSEQSNIYCITQSLSFPEILYCGTEPGEIYKSIDNGENWVCVSEASAITSGVNAIAITYYSSDTIIAGTGNSIFRSIDAGATWNLVHSGNNLNITEILINPITSSIILAAGFSGLYKSTNGGASFTLIDSKPYYDLCLKADNDNILFALRGNAATNIAEFLISNDFGDNFIAQSSGWYTSEDPTRSDGGGRISVSANNPQRVYAYLIGQSKAGDDGYIGVFRSDNGGVDWYLPNGPVGGPYTDSHHNLAYGTPDWTYHQGFYNCAIITSKTNADELLVGGLNCWKSTDGAYTFESVAGYSGGPLNLHVDMQDFRETPYSTWVTTDGGIYKSDDFLTTQPQVLNNGIRGSEYWGFGQGWNDDITIGGLYHNGVVVGYSNYGSGVGLQLGGAEPASGYVNPGPGRKVISNEVGGRILPENIGETIQSFTVSMYPNESYWAAESSEMEWHPHYYNIVFLGRDNKLWKSIDNGTSFSLVNQFGTANTAKLQHIEISPIDPDVIYVSQRPSTGSIGKLFKTIDGGASWSQITLPAGNSSRILLSLDPADKNKLWIAYPSGNDGAKVFFTEDGGISWTNITTPTLNGEEIRAIVTLPNANNAVWLFTYYNVFYLDSELLDWEIDAIGLPAVVNTCSAKPFYRDGKLRLATYGKGIWEKEFNTHPMAPIAVIMLDKHEPYIYCSPDTIYYDDHSFLNQTNALREWEFEGGTPSASTERNPIVVYHTPGSYQTVLTVTDDNGITDSDTLYVIISSYIPQEFINENFETGFLPYNWMSESSANGGSWTLSNRAGGFGNSTFSALFDNFNYDAAGGESDIFAGWNLTNAENYNLNFDVAYSRYGGQYSDSLEILVSTDCGLNWTSLYFKGGDNLATTPSITDSLFVPQADQWRTENIDLSAYSDQTNLIIKFRNHGSWGQGIYLDNILFNNTAPIEMSSKPQFLEIFPNPVESGKSIFIGSNEIIIGSFTLFSQTGKMVYKTVDFNGNGIRLPSLSSGIYYYQVIGENFIKNGKILITNRQ